MLERLGLAVPELADDRMEGDGALRIAVDGGGQQANRFDLTAQLLANLSDDRLEGRLALVDLAAGEFPFARERLTGGTLCYQQLAFALDQRTNDVQWILRAFGVPAL